MQPSRDFRGQREGSGEAGTCSGARLQLHHNPVGRRGRSLPGARRRRHHPRKRQGIGSSLLLIRFKRGGRA